MVVQFVVKVCHDKLRDLIIPISGLILNTVLACAVVDSMAAVKWLQKNI